MPERLNDIEMLKRSAKQPSAAFRHHADIMKKLDRLGFRPNPEPQVDMVTKRVDPRQVYAYGR